MGTLARITYAMRYLSERGLTLPMRDENWTDEDWMLVLEKACEDTRNEKEAKTIRRIEVQYRDKKGHLFPRWFYPRDHQDACALADEIGQWVERRRDDDDPVVIVKIQSV